MALTPEQARELQKMLLEIEKLSQKLKRNIDTTSLQDLEKSAGTIKQLFTSLSDEWEEITEDVSFAISGFQKIVQEISNVNIGLRDSNKAYKGLVSLAEDLQSHQYGIRELSSDQIKKLAEQAKLEKQRIENAQELVKERKKEQESDLKRLEREKELKKLRIEELQNLKTRTEDQEKALKEHKKQLEDLNSQYEKGNESLKKTTDIFTQNQAILENQDGLYSGLLSALDDEIRKAKNLEKALGLSGAAVDGIGKALDKAGLGALADRMGLDEAKAKMKEVAHSVTQGGNKAAGLVGQFKILGAGIGSLGRSIMKNLTDPLVMAGIAAKAVSAGVGLIKKGFSLLSGGVSSVVGFVKNLWGMADQFAAVFEKYAKAGQFAAQNFSAIGSQVNAITSGLNAAAAADPFMRVAEAGPALKAIVDGTGIMQSQMTKSVKEAHDLSYWLGYSAEETGQLYKLGQLNGKTAKDVVADVLAQGLLLNKQYKTSLDLRKVEQVAAKASAAVKFNLSQNPKALADAAFHATKLSMTLDEIAAASEQTLNFEQSIQDQLAYQAMSGKEINIDAYQQAALRGDSATAAKELNNLIAQHGPGLKNNVLLQDQFAKSVGISKDKLLEAMTAQELANTMGEDRVDIEKGLQYYMKQGLTREEAANKLAKEGLATQLAQSKRAEAMSRALEDFRDYMATKLWPLFKAVFSPANIKMFMAVISGMRPVFEELGRAITAFFSPKSAGAMTDVIKNDVMPAILDLAKMVTEVAGVLGESLFGIIKTLGPVIKKDVIPIFKYIGSIIKELAPTVGTLVQSFAQGLGKVFSKINEHKEDIKEFIEILAKGLTNTFGFVADHLKEIAITLVAFKALTAVRSLKSAIMGAPGSSAMSPMYVKNVGVPGGGGAAAGGGMMDKIKGFFGKGGKAAEAAKSTTGAVSGITGATSFADKRKMVLARQAAGEGLGSKASSAAAGAKGAAGAAGAAGGAAPSAGAGMDGAGKFGNLAGGMLKGAAALLVLSGALYVAAKAFQEFALVDWEDFGKGVAALGVLGVAAYLLGQNEKDMLKGAAAVAILGAALIPAAAAFLLFDKVDPKTLLTVAGALTILGIAAAAFGVLMETGIMELGIAAIAGLGASLIPLSAALLLATPFMESFGEIVSKVMKGLPPIIEAVAAALVKLATEASPIRLAALGLALIPLSLGLSALGEASLIFAAASGISSLLGGGGGLFGMLENLVALSNIDISKAAKSFKDGLLEFTTIGSDVDFSHLEDLFDDFEDAIEEIDIDDLIAFSDLAGKSIAGAAKSLIKGIAEFATMTDEGGKLAGKDIGANYAGIKTGLTAYFSNLEDLFDEVEDAIDELDIDELVQFGQLASVSISAAVKSLSKGLNAFSKMDIDKAGAEAAVAKLAGLEDIFDELEDAIDELDLEGLKEFAELGKGNLTNAVKVLEQGITALLGLNITFDPDSDKLAQLRKTFFKFNAALGEIDFSAVIEFAELAKADLGLAALNLKTGIEELAKQSIEVSEDNLEKVKTTLELFNDAIGAIQMDNVVKFAELAKADLSLAAANLKAGVESFASQGIAATEEQLSPMQTALEAFDTAIGAITMDNVIKFVELAKSDLSLAATNFKAGLDKFLEIAKTITKDSYADIENFQEPIQSLGMVLSVDSGLFDKVSAFAKMDLKNFVTTIGDFKLGLDKFKEISEGVTETTYDNVATLFAGLNEIFSTIDVEKITTFAGADFSKFSSSIDGFKAGLNKLAGLNSGENPIDVGALKTFLTTLSEAFVGIDLTGLTKFEDFAKADFSKFASSIKSLGAGLNETANLPTDKKAIYDLLKDDLNAFNIALSTLNLGRLGEFAAAAGTFSKLKTAITNLQGALKVLTGLAINKEIAQLKELATIDSSKLISLSEALIKLSDSFVTLAKAIKEMGDITPVVAVSDNMLKLHKSIVENPIDEDFADKLSEGLKSSVDTLMTSLAGAFGFKKQGQDGIVQGQDGVVKVKDGGLNPNGGPVVSTFQKGQLVPVLQGIKEDNVYLTTNKPQTASTGGTVVDNSAVIEAINKLTEIMASSTDKKIVVDVKSDIPAFVSKVRQTSFGG